MKRNKLLIKLLIATVAVGGLFFGGEYLAKVFLEKEVVAEETKTLSEEEKIAKEMEDFKTWREEIDNKTVKEYYEETTEINPETSKEEKVWKKGSEIVAAFEKKFGEEASGIKNKDLSEEQFGYLSALYKLYEQGENPILKRNEQPDVAFAEEMALEVGLSEIMAMTPNKDTEKILEDICKREGINPDGKVKDLTPELIIEMTDKLFEYEQAINNHGG